MSTTNIYKVHYHHEAVGKKAGPDYIAIVGAAANDFNSLKSVLSNNSLVFSGNTLVIDAVQNVFTGVNT